VRAVGCGVRRLAAMRVAGQSGQFASRCVWPPGRATEALPPCVRASQRHRLRDVLFLDMALELAGRGALESNLGAVRAAAPSTLLGGLLALLQQPVASACLAALPGQAGSAGLVAVLRQLQRLQQDTPGASPWCGVVCVAWRGVAWRCRGASACEMIVSVGTRRPVCCTPPADTGHLVCTPTLARAPGLDATAKARHALSLMQRLRSLLAAAGASTTALLQPTAVAMAGACGGRLR
jgi:hypothetical protein